MATRRAVRQSRTKQRPPSVPAREFGSQATTVRCSKGTVLFSQGDRAETLFYVETGRIAMTVTSRQGKEAVLGLLGPGDFFGEASLAGQMVRVATATTLADATIVRIPTTAMRAHLRADPAFAAKFTAYLVHRNIKTEETLVDLLFNAAERRLARVLLLLARYGSNGAPSHVIVPRLSQETLAGLVGTTRSRVNVFMTKFRRLGLVDYSGDTIKVHSTLLNVLLKD